MASELVNARLHRAPAYCWISLRMDCYPFWSRTARAPSAFHGGAGLSHRAACTAARDYHTHAECLFSANLNYPRSQYVAGSFGALGHFAHDTAKNMSTYGEFFLNDAKVAINNFEFESKMLKLF